MHLLLLAPESPLIDITGFDTNFIFARGFKHRYGVVPPTLRNGRRSGRAAPARRVGMAGIGQVRCKNNTAAPLE
ncbi:MAG: helix-turn-helix transcriptional regulator [Mycobacterium sp.]|nr:helix-turn-helix transcriptional regulator [Mycobacterium sp.]